MSARRRTTHLGHSLGHQPNIKEKRTSEISTKRKTILGRVNFKEKNTDSSFLHKLNEPPATSHETSHHVKHRKKK